MGTRKNGRARRRHARGNTPRVSRLSTTSKQASSYLYDGNRDDHDNDDHRYADVGSPRLLSMVLAFMLQY